MVEANLEPARLALLPLLGGPDDRHSGMSATGAEFIAPGNRVIHEHAALAAIPLNSVTRVVADGAAKWAGEGIRQLDRSREFGLTHAIMHASIEPFNHGTQS
jgi:hypothetical protein